MKIWYESCKKSENKKSIKQNFSLTTLAMVPSIHAQVNFQLTANGRPFAYEDDEGSAEGTPLSEVLLKGSHISTDPTRACWTCKVRVITSFLPY